MLNYNEASRAKRQPPAGPSRTRGGLALVAVLFVGLFRRLVGAGHSRLQSQLQLLTKPSISLFNLSER